MTEEELLKQTFGNANHFQVPDGFFDRFADEMMAKIEERPIEEQPKTIAKGRNAIIRRFVPYLAVASVVGLLFGVAVFHSPTDEGQNGNMQVQTLASAPSGDALDQMADYVMLDNQDLYSYMSNEY
ncbi:MAG: hypothetical protein IJ562_11400 [Prevotella sp.]|nr:hypothetical protein [Prevotella sp.]